jgi:Ca2+-binding EF-hand superfamily protein
MDAAGQGVVTKAQLEQFIISNFTKFDYSNEGIQLFIGRFDKHGRQQIKYSQFCSAFAPHDDQSKYLLN